jgi:hypothetical protein
MQHSIVSARMAQNCRELFIVGKKLALVTLQNYTSLSCIIYMQKSINQPVVFLRKLSIHTNLRSMRTALF